jgi:hypothetical protein
VKTALTVPETLKIAQKINIQRILAYGQKNIYIYIYMCVGGGGHGQILKNKTYIYIYLA